MNWYEKKKSENSIKMWKWYNFFFYLLSVYLFNTKFSVTNYCFLFYFIVLFPSSSVFFPHSLHFLPSLFLLYYFLPLQFFPHSLHFFPFLLPFLTYPCIFPSLSSLRHLFFPQSTTFFLPSLLNLSFVSSSNSITIFILLLSFSACLSSFLLPPSLLLLPPCFPLSLFIYPLSYLSFFSSIPQTNIYGSFPWLST